MDTSFAYNFDWLHNLYNIAKQTGYKNKEDQPNSQMDHDCSTTNS